MTASRDTNRLISDFLDEGIDELPAGSFDAVRAHIDHTRQRVVIGPWREDQMRRYAIFGIAAAAIVLVAVVGIRFLPADGGFAAPPPTATSSPTRSPSPSPSPSPTAAADPFPDGAGQGYPLAAGAYYFDEGHNKGTGVKRFTFTVPSGWTVADFVAKDAGTPSAVYFTAWVVSHIFKDACNWNASSMTNVIDAGTTAEQFVTALASQKNRTASAVTETTIAGFPAKQIVMTVAPTLDTATCTNGNLRYWPDPPSGPGLGPDFSGGMCCNPTGNIDTIYAVDVNGKRTVLIARHWPGSTSQNLAELQSIVDSIQIEP